VGVGAGVVVQAVRRRMVWRRKESRYFMRIL
jgi:hypothetical protein